MFIVKILSKMSKTKNTDMYDKSDITRINPQAKAELMYRIAKDIVNGMSRNRVVKKLQSDGYDMSFKTSRYTEGSMNTTYDNAVKMLKVEFDGKKEELRNVIYERYLNVYNEAMIANDRTNALNALKEINKMLGLNEPEQYNIKEDKKIIIDFGFGNNDEDDVNDGDGSEIKP